MAPAPKRGEIWFVQIPTDPPDKGPRPIIVVSREARNQHPRANTVLVVPLTTTLVESPFHLFLSPGETGLKEPSMVTAENLATVRKDSLIAPRTSLRRISETRIREIALGVVRALGFVSGDIYPG
jgi:mRNA-degrading endonuclease toxin of MazEF toxin-antitoxin module